MDPTSDNFQPDGAEIAIIEQTKYDLLAQAVINLANDTGYDFCLGCYNYGPSNIFKTSVCVICQEHICQDCGLLSSFCLNGEKYDICELCDKQLSSHNTILLLLTERNSDLSLDTFKDFTGMIDCILDQIEDELEGGEYYNYGLRYTGLILSSVGFYLIVDIHRLDGIDPSDCSDVADEIKYYLSERDGIVIDPPYLNSGAPITVDLECF